MLAVTTTVPGRVALRAPRLVIIIKKDQVACVFLSQRIRATENQSPGPQTHEALTPEEATQRTCVCQQSGPEKQLLPSRVGLS